MKRPVLSLLCAAAFLLIAVSCQKEQIVSTNETPDALKIAETQLLRSPVVVLFASLEFDHVTKLANGILIDKKGDLRRVDNVSASYLRLDDGFISDHWLRELLDKSSLIAELDRIEVAEYLTKTSYLKKTEEFTAIAEGASSSRLQLNFRLNRDYEAPASCGPGNWDRGPTHNQIVISARGQHNMTNAPGVSEELSNWLNTLNPAQEDN